MSKNATKNLDKVCQKREGASLAVVLMCLANLMLNAYIFSLIPIIYMQWGAETTIFSVLAFAMGLFVIGPFNSWFVETFPRKTVCLKSIFLLAFPFLLFLYIVDSFWMILFLGIQGIGFATAQNALCNTLINDLQVSRNRTRGDNLLNKFGHLGLPFGWLLGFYLPMLSKQFCAIPLFSFAVSASPVIIAFLAVVFIRVPLKAPIHAKVFSSDRFLRLSAWPLFLLTVLAAAIEGLFVGYSLSWNPEIIAANALYLGGGFLISLLLQKVVFADADTRAEFVSGVVFLLGALLLFLHPLDIVHSASFLLFGIGTGLLSARLLIYFLKLSGHCQRGTSQNTHFLGWRLGFAIGIIAGISINNNSIIYISLFLLAILFAIYLILIHPWFEKNKDRDFKFNGH